MYVKNEDNLIYEVKIGTMWDKSLDIKLNLICGWDYINPDCNDIQGYVPNNRFVEDVQTETEVCYYYEEGIKNCLIENGYEIIEKLPKIYDCSIEDEEISKPSECDYNEYREY